MTTRIFITAALALGLPGSPAVGATVQTGTGLSITQLVLDLFWKLGLVLTAAYVLTYVLRIAVARIGPQRRAIPGAAEAEDRDHPATVRSSFSGRLAEAVADEDDTGE